MRDFIVRLIACLSLFFINADVFSYHISSAPHEVSHEVSHEVQVLAPSTLSDPEEIKWPVLGKQTTRISGTLNRISNIGRASSKIDGIEVPPGGEFNFNKVVGPRTEANGFLEAPEIFMGDLTKGVGGGTCQVSSTLFGAAVRAGMIILERRAHSRLPDYLPPGWDAMVALNDPKVCAEDYAACSNLRFRNPRKAPVIVNMWPTGGILHAEILGEGEAPNLKIVWIRNSHTPFKTKVEFDAKLPEKSEKVAEKGKDGMIGSLVVSTPEIPIFARHVSIYKSVTQVLRVGSGWKSSNPTDDPDAGPEEHSF